MRTNARRLGLSRETVRELGADGLSVIGGRADLSGCQCTGTETYTNVCCLVDSLARASCAVAASCVCTGTETANTYCAC